MMADSLLDQAKARAAARRARRHTVSLDELAIELVCDVPTNFEDIEKLQAAAKAINRKAWVAHYARALVAAQTREIRIAGELVADSSGLPLAFNDPELWPRLDVLTAKDAVIALIGSDGDILDVSKELVAEGGFVGDDDPT